MQRSIPIRILACASDELTALMFAFRLVQPIGRLLGREPKTAVIVTGSVLRWYSREINAALGERAVHYQFHNCDEWSLETACDHIDVFARTGGNAIILSQEYLEWLESSGDHRGAIEDCLGKHDMTMILIESAAERAAELEWTFARIPEWEPVTLDQILKRITEEYQRTQTIAPVGAMLHFTLDPAVDMAGVLNPEIRLIAEYWRRGHNVVVKH